MSVCFDPLESPKWVSHALKVLKHLLLYLYYMMIMITVMIVTMIMVIPKRICQKTSKKRYSLGGGASVATF